MKKWRWREEENINPTTFTPHINYQCIIMQANRWQNSGLLNIIKYSNFCFASGRSLVWISSWGPVIPFL
jgi:hypothetical protein